MLAFVFPGQGSQFVGMGKALNEKYHIARDTFDEADAVLGRRISELCFEGPAHELEQTYNAQPAILATSVAAFRVLVSEIGLRPTVMAGHSLGEITAYTCAEALEFAAALELVQQRGRLMQEAVPAGAGRMAAVMGLPADEMAEICSAAAGTETVSVVNYNGPSQLVVSGHAGAVERAQALAEQRGAVTRSLSVSAPFHCDLMDSAATRFERELERAAFRQPLVLVVDGASGELHHTTAGVVELLASQVRSPVRWDKVMSRLAALSVWCAVEVGPGARLSSMIRRAEPDIRTAHFGEPADLNALQSLAAERPYLERPLGHWQLTDTGDLFSPKDFQVAWAGTDRLEPVSNEYWTVYPNGTRVHKYGTMAIITPDWNLQTFDSESWFPREDGAYVRKDHTQIVARSGEIEYFDPREWKVDSSGTMSRTDGTRIIWSDGSQWIFDAD